MPVTVLYFAVARERAGVDEETVEVPPPRTIGALSKRIGRLHPGLAPLLSQLRWAVNQKIVRSSHPVRDGDEVALIPPVAGGSGQLLLTDRPLALGEVVAAVEDPEHGAVVAFLGTVRQSSRGRQVVRLEYEAFAPMALEKLHEIAEKTRVRWPEARVAIHHRLGSLQVGEAALTMAAAAPHRREAFRACEWALEQLKKDVPIWKKEVFADGEAWVGLKPPRAGRAGRTHRQQRAATRASPAPRRGRP
jgi:molybdopterin synthase catalytic subunit